MRQPSPFVIAQGDVDGIGGAGYAAMGRSPSTSCLLYTSDAADDFAVV